MKLIFRMNPIIPHTIHMPSEAVIQKYNTIRIMKYYSFSLDGNGRTWEEHDVLPEEWRFLFKRLYMYVVLP